MATDDAGHNGARARRERPLLGGGEELSRDVQPARGPGTKFHPQTLQDVRRELGPAVHDVRVAATAVPPDMRGDRIVIEATLLPNYLAASHHPAALRAEADLVPVGTRNARGTLRTARSESREEPTKTLLLAATTKSLERLDVLLNEEDTPADEPVLNDLIKLQDLGLPDEGRIFGRRQMSDDADGVNGDADEILTWEAVLHPAVNAAGRLSERAHELVMDRWRRLLEQHDGHIHEDFVRPVGHLTFMPVSLPRRALSAIAMFNPLRVLRPMPRMRAIPTGLRGVDLGPLAPAPPADPAMPEHRIAVFDGGAAGHGLLDRYVVHGDLTPSARDAEDEEHGTLVTSGLLYGHIAIGAPLEVPRAD